MVGGTYTDIQTVYDLSGLGTYEITSAEGTPLIEAASSDLETMTNKVWGGSEHKEHCGRGDGTTKAFYVSYIPIVDGIDGTATNDPAKITVTQDGTTAASANYTLLGSDGRIDFVDAPDSDDKIEVSYHYDRGRIKYAATYLTIALAYSRLKGGGGDPEEIRKWEDKALRILEEFGAPIKAGWSRSS